MQILWNRRKSGKGSGSRQYFHPSGGKFAAIVGKSGSGKSTLLHMLGGLDTPTSGTVWMKGKDIFSLKEDALAVFRRRKIGFIFQTFNLVSSINVWENIVLPIGLDGRQPEETFVRDIIQTLGIEDKLQNLPNTLSGGPAAESGHCESAGVVNRISFLPMNQPEILDSKTSDESHRTAEIVRGKYGQTLVMITHDDEIAQIADRVLVIEDGKVAEM